MRKLVVAGLMAMLALPATAAADTNGTPVPGRYIVVLKDSASGRSVASEHRRVLGASVSHTYDHALHGYAAKLSDAALARVKADPRVARVVQDREGVAIQAQTLPNSLNRIDAELSPLAPGDGTGTAPGDVAVMDTGIQTDHPDLNVAGGVNCVGSYGTHDGTIGDQQGHGTHVAGTIGAKDDDTGTVGVAPGVRLWSVRTLDFMASGSTATQLCGIDWVTEHGPALGIKVVNSSQVLFAAADAGNCGVSNNNVLHQAICRSTDAGILWVFAAGNSSGSLALSSGPSFDEVLAVTAAADGNGQPNVGSGTSFTCPIVNGTRKFPNSSPQTDDQIAGFSNWAVGADAAHTIAAPGACVWSTYKGSAYGNMSGTSMAAPHVAAAAHLCIASGQCSGTPAETIQKLRADAETHSLANPGYGFTGDPLRPTPDRFYGHLLPAHLYGAP
jgi:subtilisin family serine protease